ncbi:MAG: PQQ-binding-like beta-propeller repeat protein [Phycisphaerae bacterium]
MRTILPLVALSAWSSVIVAAEPEWIGYGGPEGSRVYPDQDPPTKFNHIKGDGVKWETPLPIWGHGSPVTVAGKIFLMCEVGPKNPFPLLVCLDAETGKVLWKKEVDHTPAIAPGSERQQELRGRVKAYFDREAELLAKSASGKGRKRFTPKKDKAQNREEKALYASMGFMRDKFRRAQYCSAYACFGDAYATPVTDGKHVYVSTLWGGFACYDFEGRLKWVSFSRGGRWTWCNLGRSPIIYRNQLISNLAGTMRSFDKNTGKLLWSHEDPKGAYGIVSPAVITTGGRDVLLAAGPSAYLLPEGKPLRGVGWVSEGMQILVHPRQRDVAHFCGSGEHCGWKNKGDTLTGKVLWHGGDLATTRVWGGNAPWMVIHNNRLYHREGAIMDAMTGKVLAGKLGGRWLNERAAPRTEHFLKVAGGHVYGLYRAKGTDEAPGATMNVYTLEGKHVSSNPLFRRKPTPAQQEMHKYATGFPTPWLTGRKTKFSYGYTFTFGNDRIYIRSLEALICIGQ